MTTFCEYLKGKEKYRSQIHDNVEKLDPKLFYVSKDNLYIDSGEMRDIIEECEGKKRVDVEVYDQEKGRRTENGVLLSADWFISLKEP